MQKVSDKTLPTTATPPNHLQKTVAVPFAVSLESNQIRKAEQTYSVGILASGIAHELNNPLNAILMNAELGLLVAQKGADQAKMLRILQTVAKEAKRAGQLTRRISDFARSHDACREKGDFNQIVTKARTLTGSLLRRHNVELELCLDPTLPTCLLDQTACEQAVAHLLTNAAEANASKIKATTFRYNESIGLSIIDNGSGIAVDPQEQIFEPFFTTRQSLGKLGLGLSLTRRIVSEHRGFISAENTKDGTRFTINLPTG